MRERFFKLRDKLLNTTPKICIERAKIVTEAYKKYDAYPNIEKRAMALADVLRNMTIYIEEEQLLAGNQASSNRAAPLFPEYAFAYILDELDDLEKRSSDKFTITEENKKVLREILPWWEGKTLKDRAIAMQPQEVLDDRVTGVLGWQGNVSTGEGHIVPDYDMVVRLGFAGLRDKIQKHIDELDLSKPQDLEKLTFYRACKAIIDGCLDYIKRYCILAEEQAEQCKDAARKEELLGISERCQALLERAPETFFEALQCVWFVQVILHIETNGHSLSFGRFDQYMYPYYKADIEKGILTPEKAMELIEELYIRVTSNVWFQSTQMAYIFGGYYRYPHLDVGGLDENGKDASNELSYLCLRAMRYAKTTSPAVSILLHQKTPDSLLYEACELAAEGMGHPSFFNCEGLYAMLEHRAGGLEGYSNYTRKDILKFGSPIGCVEPGAEGLQYGHTDSGIINVAGAALMAVTNGIMPEGTDNMFAGKLLTYESGAPETFETFDQFYAAVKAQIKYAIDEAHANLLVCEKLLAEQFNLPTFTVLLEGALEKAKDATAGGAKVNVGPTMNMSGFGTMVDSVAAIKKVVYTDHKATLAQVRDACMANFQGYEDLRIQLQAAPKYGNDDDFADDIAADLWEWFAQCTMGLKMYRGHYCDAAVQMVQSNVGYGAMTGATPNGRLAGMPLSDTMSATQQADTHGPTAAARSYGKLDFPVYTNGTLLNMWISQSELMEKQ